MTLGSHVENLRAGLGPHMSLISMEMAPDPRWGGNDGELLWGLSIITGKVGEGRRSEGDILALPFVWGMGVSSQDCALRPGHMTLPHWTPPSCLV